MLTLKDSWTKGGRPREVPVRTAEQRQILDEVKALASAGSLIPAAKTYAQQLHRFEYQCGAAGIHRVRGFRHQYAQARYRELTGWQPPAAGGPKSQELTAEQRKIDREARLTISAELGHEQEQVTAVCLPRQRSPPQLLLVSHDEVRGELYGPHIRHPNELQRSSRPS